jgi:hypothetical protein
MRRSYWCVAFLSIFSLFVAAQDKPQVYVQAQASATGSGMRFAVLGSKAAGNPDQDGAEFGKIMEQDCSSVTVTSEKNTADYTITVTSNSTKRNRDLRKSQVQVSRRDSKAVGTNYFHTSGDAVKDACELIATDWKNRDTAMGSGNSELTPGVTLPPRSTVDTPTPQPVDSPVSGRFQTGSSTGVAAGGSSAGEDLGDAARRAKQHAACLKLERENPSITCK